MEIDWEFLDDCAEDVKVAYVLEYLKAAKIFASKAEYEFCLKVVQDQISFLRRLAASGAVIKRIETWQRLDRLEAKVERLWNTTRFVWSQSKGKGKHGEEDFGTPLQWQSATAEQARIYTQQGKMVRTTGEGTHKRWEVAND